MIKEKNKQMIKLLRNNSRMKIKEISDELNIPIATAFERLKKIQNVVMKNTSLIDFIKLNYSISVILGIKVSDQNKNQLKHFLLNHHNVNNLYQCTGNYNLVVEAIFKNLEEADNFNELIHSFCPIKIIEHQIINEIKKEEFYT